MAKAGLSWRTGAAVISAGLWAGSAVAPAAAAPTPAELAAWVNAHTDLAVARVAIAGPEQVYSLEQLGPRTTTGEVIALVRSETIAADPLAGLQSWEAHLLFDCAGGRLRQIRSVTWPARNRTGKPTSQPPREGWITPQPEQPAMQLLAAACDPTFAWPLRPVQRVEAGPAPAPAAAPRPAGPPQPEYLPDIRPARASLPPLAAAPPPKPGLPAPSATGGYGVQIARGPSKEGAAKALTAARRALGADADGLATAIDVGHVGAKRRYTAVLAGFATEAAAEEACDKLAVAGQECFTVRR